MNAEKLVKALRQYAGEAAVRSVDSQLREPTGRSPHKTLVADSKWYLALNAKDQAHVMRIARRTMDYAIFGVLCILDGVRAIEAGPSKGELHIVYVKGTEQTVISDPNEVLLHELYSALYPFE